MKIAAIPTVAEGFRTQEPHLGKATIVHVVNVAEQEAQLGAAVFHAGVVPEALRDTGIKKNRVPAIACFPINRTCA